MSINNALSAGATFLIYDSVTSNSSMEDNLQDAGVAAISNYVGGWITPSLDNNSNGGSTELITSAISGAVYAGISTFTGTGGGDGFLVNMIQGTILMAASDCAIAPILNSSSMSSWL